MKVVLKSLKIGQNLQSLSRERWKPSESTNKYWHSWNLITLFWPQNHQIQGKLSDNDHSKPAIRIQPATSPIIFIVTIHWPQSCISVLGSYAPLRLWTSIFYILLLKEHHVFGLLCDLYCQGNIIVAIYIVAICFIGQFSMPHCTY